MADKASSRLFTSLKLNSSITLRHRVGMSPLTRYRADDNHIPTDMMREYYAQRASVPGTLIITEGTFPSAAQGGQANVPGIYTDAQVEGWRPITEAVHARGSYILCQLWALGRAADPEVAKSEGIAITSSSPRGLKGMATPKPLTKDEIRQTVEDYAHAARNAIRAGFDGVELHGANGYLIDQFTQDMVNERTDEYGGSIENRSRFAIEVVGAVVDAVGAERTGIRLSPWSQFQEMRMDDPIPQFSDLIQRLGKWQLAYIHLVESRVAGNADVEAVDKLDFAYNIWKGVLLVAGGYKSDSARRLVDEEHPHRNIIVMFGRYFLSTPDLPFRLQKGIDPNPYKRDTFYVPKSREGYTDYQFSKEFLTESKET